MKQIGKWQTQGYTVAAYWPEHTSPDVWTLHVLREERLVAEFTERMSVESPYGTDAVAMARLDAAAEAALILVRIREDQRIRDDAREKELAVG